ncbi:hypothetical protein Tco_0299955 [Tanacetum coccineum]
MEEINNFQQEPDKILLQAWECFKELLMKCPQHYLTEMQEVILFYNGLEVPTQHILDSRGAIPTKTAADAKKSELKTDAAIRNQGASIKTLEIQIGKMSKVLQEREFGSLPSTTEANPRDQVKSISTTIEADSYPIHRASVSDMPLSTYLNLGLGELADRTMKYPKGIAENVLVDHFCLPPVLKIDVYKRKITLRIGEERIIIKSVKPASSLIKRVYMLSLRERMELDLEARLMGETLVINRSLDPLNGDYIELNDLNEPFELRRTQGDDFMPTIEKGEVIEEFRNKNDELDTEINDYPILENMDAYRDEGMGDVIFGEPFLKEVGIKARRFEGIITIYNGNKSVSDEDEMNGITHAYQKLKGFYKGVLNLGPDYIQDAKTEEWLTRGHISVHEIESEEKLKKSLT